MTLGEAQKLARLAAARYGVDAAAAQQVLAAHWTRHGSNSLPQHYLMALVNADLLELRQAEEILAALVQTDPDIGSNVTAKMPVSSCSKRCSSLPPSLDGYDLLRKLGEGGMGEVHLVRHAATGQIYAMKILFPALAEQPTLLERFQREARHAARLDHPNLVRGFGAGQDAATGLHYLLMEFVDGPSVQRLLEQLGRLTVPDAVRIAIDIVRALEHLHTRGIIHRDLKPENVLLTAAGLAKLTDMGLSKEINLASSLTQTRHGFGTPFYVPYEQAVNARAADERSDLFALGATLYHMLAGQLPFFGNTVLEILEKKAQGDFIPVRQLCSEAPAELDLLVSRLLARKPSERPQTASEVIVALERLNLASPILSLVDRQEALRDPTIRLRVALSQQVTQPDGIMVSSHPAAPDERWHLEIIDSNGRTRRVQASTAHILKSLRKGKLSSQVRVSRDFDGPYLKLEHWTEFKAAVTHSDRPTSPATSAHGTTTKEQSQSVPSTGLRSTADARSPAHWWWIGLLGLCVGLLGLLVVLQWLS